MKQAINEDKQRINREAEEEKAKLRQEKAKEKKEEKRVWEEVCSLIPLVLNKIADNNYKGYSEVKDKVFWDLGKTSIVPQGHYSERPHLLPTYGCRIDNHGTVYIASRAAISQQGKVLYKDKDINKLRLASEILVVMQKFLKA